MNTNRNMLGLASVLFVTLTGCASREPHEPPNWALAVQTAESKEAHQALADHYDDVAGKLSAEANEERRVLDKYIAAPHKYGKRIQDLKARAQSEINALELASKESTQLARYHRLLAEEAGK